MLAKREKLLLTLLICIVGVVAIAIALSLGFERLGAARTKSAEYTAQIKKLAQTLPSQAEISTLRDRLAAALVEARSRFYSAEEMNPYSFGALIKKKLASHGIKVIRYQVIELKGSNSLEFSVSGSARSLVLFIKEVSESEKYWTISSLTLNMHEGTETADAVFRIGYEVLTAKNG